MRGCVVFRLGDVLDVVIVQVTVVMMLRLRYSNALLFPLDSLPQSSRLLLRPTNIKIKILKTMQQKLKSPSRLLQLCELSPSLLAPLHLLLLLPDLPDHLLLHVDGQSPLLLLLDQSEVSIQVT